MRRCLDRHARLQKHSCEMAGAGHTLDLALPAISKRKAPSRLAAKATAKPKKAKKAKKADAGTLAKVMAAAAVPVKATAGDEVSALDRLPSRV